MQWEIDADLKKIRSAAELARRGVESKPGSLGPLLFFSKALTALGEFDRAANCLRNAVAAFPPSAELETALTEALLAQDLFEEALPHAERALAIAAGDRRAKRLYLDVLAGLKDWDKAALDMEAVRAFAPSNPVLMEMQARSIGAAQSLELCDRQLAANPAHTNAKFLKAVALAELGRAQQARDLIALDRQVKIRAVETPAGYRDGCVFREALAQEIRANPTLARDPKSRTTRGGMRTRFLRQPDAVAIEALLGRIRTAVDDYVGCLVASGDEFAVCRPAGVRLRAWAVINTSSGRQIPHRHPDGWLSGVFYVAAPRLAGEGLWRGPLILGALASGERATEPPWGIRRIEPVPGRLVLFPSYVPHATEPSGTDGERICVAFDVVPVADC